MDAGTIGGIAGGVLGVLGGVVGTLFSIRNTSGPRERAFTIRAVALMWAGLTAYLAGMWLTPSSYRPLLWVPYSILLPIVIRTWNRRQEEIRREEVGQEHDGSSSPPG